MFTRFALAKVRQELQRSPAVAILGARQVGKTTLARQVAREYPSALYLDLENSDDRARLAQPGAYFRANRERLVVLDEIQNAPELLASCAARLTTTAGRDDF